MVTTFYARKLIANSAIIDCPVVRTEGGRIVDIAAGPPNGSSETLSAPFFDVHVHGACSYDFMAANPREVLAVGQFLAGRGVGHYLPTTVTGPLDSTLRALETLADSIEAPLDNGAARPAAVPVGIHLEGPFVSHVKRGVHPTDSIREPDIALFDRLQQAARGHIRLMTLAPELPHALDLIRHVTGSGVRVSMGHSNATFAETEAAISAGASSATHLFNAMRALDHREPGIVGTILQRDDVYAELICDGVHVHPAMVRLWMKMKGNERAILVTDGMSATGMPDGTYTLGNFEVQVKHGVCMFGETLAGSVLTMDGAVANVQQFTGISLESAVRLATRNPAAMLGMEHLTAMRPGDPADFNVFNDAGEFTGRIRGGRRLV
jgi:N-acetylglucosamine-6-phosphate deacetylase